MPAKTLSRRGVAVRRVSEVGGREGDRFASPPIQTERIQTECDRLSIDLVAVYDEMDISGGLPLAERTGLRRALEDIEAGRAEVLIGAYFDRLFRNLREQTDVVQRVEAADGQVLAVDFGQVSEDNAAQWLSGTLMGAVSEYFKRSAKERSGAAVQRAIDRGVPPWPNVTPGYVRNADGRFQPDPELAPVVLEAFRLRCTPGVTLAGVHTFLCANGFPDISLRRVQTLLKSRVVRGEIHFKSYKNLTAHTAIVDEDTWQRAQRAAEPRGRQAKSEHLLARQRVLTCGSCGGWMVINSVKRQYRCGSNNECSHRVAIGAAHVEDLIVTAVREVLADVQGRASAVANVRAADAAVVRTDEALQNAIRTLAGMVGEPATAETLQALQVARDAARADRARLGDTPTALTLNTADDWNRLTLTERRELIRSTVTHAIVMPGRGADRVRIGLLGAFELRG
jgi:DNA invertase Pin-like site-specific DNA recombinase